MAGLMEGRVVVVTGAARGIGREHARLMASQGAQVVVNDLGGASDGTGGDSAAAEAVVEEIVSAGGSAVASSDSVCSFDGARRIVETATDAFGDLHAVVNNAGVLRDRMLVSMTEEEFDTVVAVHLKGTFNVSHWAARYWRDRAKSGATAPRSIVNTSSDAGLTGNVGQTNYAAAKAGIAAMTIVAGMELERYHVRTNGVAPVARTRLTIETPGLEGPMAGAQFDPRHISPLVAYLSSESCRFNGQMFSVVGTEIGIYGGWSIGAEISTDDDWDLESLSRAIEQLPLAVPTQSQRSKPVVAALFGEDDRAG